MEDGRREDVIQGLIRRLACVGPEGDRKLDADIWYALTDHRIAPGRYTRSIDGALAFATAFHRARDIRFGIVQEGDAGWVAIARVWDGAPPWELLSAHPHPAPALMQAALRAAVLRPATTQRAGVTVGVVAISPDPLGVTGG